MRENRRPDGTIESVCVQCQSVSRCGLCGFSSKDQKNFGVRKVDGKWRVLCNKCVEGQEGPSGPSGPERAGREGHKA